MKKRILLPVIFTTLLLFGCSGREMEEREFPTAVTLWEGNPKELFDKRQREDRNYLDYSHTKAVILHESVVRKEENLKEIMEYLKNHPEFARNMLVFVGGEKELTLAEEKKDTVGMELAAWYKNQPKEMDLEAVRLIDLLNAYGNGQEEIALPRVVVSGEELIPESNSSVQVYFS